MCLATRHQREHWGDSCRPRTYPVPFALLSPVVVSRIITLSSTFPRQAAGACGARGAEAGSLGLIPRNDCFLKKLRYNSYDIKPPLFKPLGFKQGTLEVMAGALRMVPRAPACNSPACGISSP